ncbi:MAG TPA: SGNH/GDSL hydrolase family protein [Terriglobales bacterium]
MRLRVSLTRLCVLLVLLCAFSALSMASAFNGVVVYGDSVVDNGNLFALTGVPGPPYWKGRFSNGPVSVEYLAQSLSAPLMDYAYGGATSGIGNTGDGGTQTTLGFAHLPGMISEYLATVGSITPSEESHSLFIVFAALGNDLKSNGFSTTTADTAVHDVISIVTGLQAKGVQHILVAGAPDVGLGPSVVALGAGPAATALSKYYNGELQLDLQGKGVIYFDTFGVEHQLVQNPAKYGLVDVTDPCFNGTTVCANPNQYLFWDGSHPTTAVDELLAQRFEQAVVPEPASLVMLGTGVLGVLGYRRRVARPTGGFYKRGCQEKTLLPRREQR